MHLARVKYQCRSCRRNEGVHLSQWYSVVSNAARKSPWVFKHEDSILVRSIEMGCLGLVDDGVTDAGG